MSEILKVIQERQSARVPYDPNKQVEKDDLKKILEQQSGLRQRITCKTSK